jgi:hypothetical protein
MWDDGTDELKSRGITLESNISFVSAYLQKICFFKSLYFLLTLVY